MKSDLEFRGGRDFNGHDGLHDLGTVMCRMPEGNTCDGVRKIKCDDVREHAKQLGYQRDVHVMMSEKQNVMMSENTRSCQRERKDMM
jgi:hypothetical protein